MRTVVIPGAQQIHVVEKEQPVPGDGEVLLRVAHVGVCGSDLNYYGKGATGEYTIREPLTPGHELSGWVEHDPSGELAPGTPVTVHPARFGQELDGLADAPHLWPGGSYLGSAATWPHTQGAMAEYLVVEQPMIRVLPHDLPIRRAALAEPLAVALHGLTLAASHGAGTPNGDLAGVRVLVSGAGPIGLLALAAAIARGAEVSASDVLAGPLARASEMGAVATYRAGEDEIPAGAFDLVLECSGAAVAVTTAVTAAARRGVVVQLGMLANEPRPINLAPMLAKELVMLGTFRFAEEIDEAVTMLAAHPELEAVITHAFTVDEVAEAFAVARDGERSGKVLVTLASERD